MAATPLFVQAQSFALQASGASSGDTSITLQAFKLSDGTTNITTAMIGSVCYGTLEPNNGTQEEAIQFTGVTQNANGTATLTGVSSVGFISPYTATSGLSKSHAGGVTFILSNDAAFYGNIVTYINGVVASGASLASTTVAGISKLSVAPVSGANPISVGDNDNRMLASGTTMYVNSIQNTGIPYAVATGTATAYTATLASSISSLASGTSLNFLVPITNASGATLNVNSLGAKGLKKNVSTILASGDIIAGQVANVVYDGTNFQVMSRLASASQSSSGTGTQDVSSTTTVTIAHGLGAIPKLVRLNYIFTDVNTVNDCTVSYAGTTQSAIAKSTRFIAAVTVAMTQNFYLANDGGFATRLSGTVTADATNITITWAKTGSPTGTWTYLWEATS